VEGLVESLRIALVVGMVLFFVALVAFNAYMARMYKRAGAAAPTGVVVIRVLNAILLLVAAAIVVSALVRR
jgi:small-conductance mechanosensitive channel